MCQSILMLYTKLTHQKLLSYWAQEEFTVRLKCHLLEGGRHVWPRFSQLFILKIGKFLYSLERKNPEFFKTDPTFVSWPLLRPSTASKTLIPIFFGTPCKYLIFDVKWCFVQYLLPDKMHNILLLQQKKIKKSVLPTILNWQFRFFWLLQKP